jgi:hypothetical protein
MYMECGVRGRLKLVQVVVLFDCSIISIGSLLIGAALLLALADSGHHLSELPLLGRTHEAGLGVLLTDP